MVASSRATIASREKEARFTMLEKLADHDDELMEQLLEDIPPPRDKVFDDLAKELREGLVCPVLIGRRDPHQRRAAAAEGAAPRGAGRRRDREAPRRQGATATTRSPMCSRRCTPRTAARCRSPACSSGEVGDGVTLQSPDGEAGRVSGVFKLHRAGQREARTGRRPAKRSALGKLDSARTGDTLSSGKQPHKPRRRRSQPYRRCWRSPLRAKERKDDVKLGQALNKLRRGGPVAHRRAQCRRPTKSSLWGQGEMHLRVAAERLSRALRRADRRRAADASAIARPSASRSSQRGRHKKQSGGHGQFGDVVLDIKPLPRGAASRSRTRSPAAWCRATTSRRSRKGVDDGLKHGPLGFPVVDVAVTLIDGSYHAVNSSDMAFRTPAASAWSRRCRNASRCCSSRSMVVMVVPVGSERQDQRHPLGTARPDPRLRHARRLDGWDVVRALMPGSRDRRPDHRAPLGHGRRRQLHLQVRPHGQLTAAHRRPDDRGPQGQGGLTGIDLRHPHRGSDSNIRVNRLFMG